MPRLFDAGHLVALGVTLAAEAGGMALLAALYAPTRGRVRRCAGVAVGLNLVTHMAFWVGYPLLAGSAPGGLLGAEGVVTLVEAVAYRVLCPLGWWPALSASAVLNLLSFVLGVEIGRAYA